ncbi:hypothetical protein Syun_029210 [Stephania yunnanensis]|uniref:Uncharacterized protein n=1 Tax=Stephania yunnanensis TaxID=152371 RepID=A0AAP0E553_9MAGN
MVTLLFLTPLQKIATGLLSLTTFSDGMYQNSMPIAILIYFCSVPLHLLSFLVKSGLESRPNLAAFVPPLSTTFGRKIGGAGWSEGGQTVLSLLRNRESCGGGMGKAVTLRVAEDGGDGESFCGRRTAGSGDSCVGGGGILVYGRDEGASSDKPVAAATATTANKFHHRFTKSDDDGFLHSRGDVGRSVYLAAVLEYLAAECLRISLFVFVILGSFEMVNAYASVGVGRGTQRGTTRRLGSPSPHTLAVRNDEELKKLLGAK